MVVKKILSKIIENWKIKIIFFLFIILAGSIVWKLYDLQITNGDYHKALALGQQVSFKQAMDRRGDIVINGKNPSLAQFGKKDKNNEEIMARYYPYNSFASHVVGFVNDAGEGQYGLEGYYDKALKGDSGLLKKGVGYLASILDSDNQPFLEQGSDLYLTLDYNIQYFAEKLLFQAKNDWDIDSGQIIVSDPLTGRILALANFPSFDPNLYYKEDLSALSNSVYQKLYEPGSVLKALTMASGLEEDLVEPDTTYIDEGFVEVGGPKIYNYDERIWGEQSMTDVLEESINTGAIFVQQELGKKKFLNYLDKFGLFKKTNIDLQGEVYSSNNTLKNGYPRDFAVASFGQGIEITPIQLVRAFGALANGGILLKPYIVDKVVEPNGKERVIEPEEQGRVISEETSLTISSMLANVVKQGAGRRAQIAGYSIAGKTGTAQVIEKGKYLEDETIQSFISYFPASSPEVLIYVKLDNPKGVNTSAHSAVPLFRELAKYVIDLREIPPDLDL